MLIQTALTNYVSCIINCNRIYIAYGSNDEPTFVMIDKSGKEVKDIVLYLDTNLDKYYCKVSEYVHEYTVDPPLPNRFSLGRDGILVSNPGELLEKTQYTIWANLGTTKVSCNITIAVINCPYDKIYKFDVRSEANVTYTSGERVIYQGLVKNDYVSFCLPYTDYDYTITCLRGIWSSDECLAQFTTTKKQYFKIFEILVGETQSGSVSYVETKPPVLTIKPFITLNSNTNAEVYDCEGAEYNTVVEPSYSWIQVIMDERKLQFTSPPAGVYELSLVSTNSIGSSRVSFTLAVNQCPQGMERINLLRDRSGQNNEFIEVYENGNKLYATEDASQTAIDAMICVKPNTPYFFHMYGHRDSGWLERIPLVISDDAGTIAEYNIPRGKQEENRNFYYASLVPLNSKLQFTKSTPADNWIMPRFKETWKEAQTENWGSFEANEHLYIRKSFTPNLDHYSQLFVDLKTDNYATVYLNGREIGGIKEITPSHYQRFLIPLSYIEKENLVAVDVKKAPEQVNATSISFDLKVFAVSSMNIQQSVGGTPVSSQAAEDPKYSVMNAFDMKEDTYWNVTAYPASVDYFFSNSQKRVANMLMIHKAYSDSISSMRIEGIRDDNSTVILHTLKSKVFTTEKLFEYVRFDNNDFYRGYRLVIENSAHSTPMGLCDIRFMFANPLSCDKKFGVDTTELDSITYKNCPFYQVGKKQIKCVESEFEAVWVDDRSACLPRHPSRPHSYVDLIFVIDNMLVENFESLKEKMIEMIYNNLLVFGREIHFSMVRDVSTNDLYKTEVTIRFTVDYRIGDYIQYYLEETLQPTFDSLVKQYLGNQYSGSYVEKPRLYTPTNWLVVTIVILVVSICILLIVVYLLVRGKSDNKPKKLRKKLGKKGDSEGLLDTVV